MKNNATYWIRILIVFYVTSVIALNTCAHYLFMTQYTADAPKCQLRMWVTSHCALNVKNELKKMNASKKIIFDDGTNWKSREDPAQATEEQ